MKWIRVDFMNEARSLVLVAFLWTPTRRTDRSPALGWTGAGGSLELSRTGLQFELVNHFASWITTQVPGAVICAVALSCSRNWSNRA